LTTETLPRPLHIAVCGDLTDLNVQSAFGSLEAAGHRVTLLSAGDKDTVISEAGDADALMLGYGEVDDEVLEALPRLRMIALASMGFDNVDLESAARRGISVSHIVGAATEEVATHALALALDALRRTSAYDRAVRAGTWNLESAPIPPRISQLTLGVVGLGRIGMALVERARPLFGTILGFDPFLPDDRIRKLGVQPATFDEVLANAEVLSLHLPLTDETADLLNAETFARMKRGATLVNVSRGGLINSADLREALDNGTIGAAALDVLDVEPPPADHPLLGHPLVTLTPHSAFLSDAALADYVRLQAENVLTWARTGTPLTPVPAHA
jgi:phosphoglycerate dehydrogenase-like enzyme